MNVLDYQVAFGVGDKTTRAMSQAQKRWRALYYQQPATDGSDPCQRIAYTVVSKIMRAVFAEYTAAAADPVAAGWLQALEKCKEQAMEMVLSGGECCVKPYPMAGGFGFTLIPRENMLVFARDADGNPTDVGTAERCTVGKQYFTLLERRTISGQWLTIENKLYRSSQPEQLGYEVALSSCPNFAALPKVARYPMGHLGLVRLKSPLPNCIDGSADGVAVFAPAEQLIGQIDRNEAQLSGEFDRGQSRIFLSRDLLDKDKNLSESLFVGLDEDPESVGITIFAPQLRQEAYHARKQEYLRNAETIMGLKRGMLSDVNMDQRTATEIAASQADFSLTVAQFQQVWQQGVEYVMALCRVLAQMYGMAQPGDTSVRFDWGNGVLFDEEKVWADYLTMADKGLIAPEVALGWRFGMKAETEEERKAIRERFMPK